MQPGGDGVIYTLLPFLLWHYVEGRMELVNFEQDDYRKMAASGKCPHCSVAAFFPQSVIYLEKPVSRDGNRWEQRAASICECSSCKQFILVVGIRTTPAGGSLDSTTQGVKAPFSLVGVFPIGKPNEAVDKSVPKGVAEDFKEAQRCYFIKANRATAIMCRRSLETSTADLGAQGKNLRAKIDDLSSKGRITQVLRDFAHHLRATGNLGAHDPSVGAISRKDAADVLQFTQQYLDHIYVLPAKLKSKKKP